MDQRLLIDRKMHILFYEETVCRRDTKTEKKSYLIGKMFIAILALLFSANEGSKEQTQKKGEIGFLRQSTLRSTDTPTPKRKTIIYRLATTPCLCYIFLSSNSSVSSKENRRDDFANKSFKICN